MRLRCPLTWSPLGVLRLLTLSASPHVAYAMDSYPMSPDARSCSRYLGHPLDQRACQAAVDNLPKGTLPSIFTTRTRTATNNYVQVPVHFADAESNPTCLVTIDLDGHSQNDQFVFVPWIEIKEMAQIIVDSCVSPSNRGGFITYGVGRTFESLIHPTSYEGDNVEIPTPAWVWQPDESVEFVAIPYAPATNEYSKFCGQPECSISNSSML